MRASSAVSAVTKSLRSASLTISLSCPHLRPKAMRVSVSAGRSGREGTDACQQRSLGECRSGRWGYYSLAKGGGWAAAPRQLMRLEATRAGNA